MKKRKVFLLVCAAVTAVLSAVITTNSLWDSIFIASGISSVFTQSEKYPLAVFFFDVGRANAVLIRCKDRCVMIDCGMEKMQGNSLDYLSVLGIEKLDMLILTHPDKDHIGNMSELVSLVEVDRFVTCRNGEYELTQTYRDLLNSLDSRNISVEYAEAGDVFEIGDLQLNVVSPNKVYDTSNNNSVAIAARYGNFSVFLTGDIQEEAERDILSNNFDISADVLCVAHHGSGYSTTDDFLSKVNPKTAVISVEENDFLPSDKVLTKLTELGCDIFRTDEYGTIAVVSDGKEYKTITQFNME